MNGKAHENDSNQSGVSKQKKKKTHYLNDMLFT